VVPLDRPWLGHQLLYIFNFLFQFLILYFGLKVLATEYQNPSNSLILRRERFVWAQADHLSKNLFPKNAGTIHSIFGGQFRVSRKGSEYSSCAALWLIFKSIKRGPPANGKKDSIASPLLEELGDINIGVIFVLRHLKL
jgi:hypothetical protein